MAIFGIFIARISCYQLYEIYNRKFNKKFLAIQAWIIFFESIRIYYFGILPLKQESDLKRSNTYALLHWSLSWKHTHRSSGNADT